MGERGCRHVFTWGGSWPPPEMIQTNCCSCGTSAQWQNGAWDVFQESPASQSLAAWREVAQALAEALREHGAGGCREWLHEQRNRCGAPAEFVLWGKPIDPEGLGPRCYDHAAAHVGHRALGDPAWAIIDLRPGQRALARFDALNTEEKR